MRKMKDSGIAWIGEIPEEWGIAKIKNLYSIILGKMICNERLKEDYTYENYLCSINVKWKGVDTSIIKKMWFSNKEKELYKLKTGDLLITEGGRAGESCIYKGECEPCYIQNAVHKATGINGNLNVFLYYWMQLLDSVNYFMLVCNKATILHYTKDQVHDTPIIYVPIKEQQKIADFLDKNCAEIDKLIELQESMIEKLKEYKQSVITQAVTKGLGVAGEHD